MTSWPSSHIPEFTRRDRLRKAREDAGLNVKDFAEELGMSRTTVHKYEQDDEAEIPKLVFMGWSMRTGVPREWLETGTDPNERGDS